MSNFISGTLRDPEFTADLENFVGRLAEAAAINSLAQTLIKLTAPGVPDIYQGCELWDFSLVDPDNRRPVDFNRCQNLLVEAGRVSAQKAWERRAEGFPKLWLVQKTLKLRASICRLLLSLNYEPVIARGAKGEHVVAFSRGGRIITVVPRFLLKLNNDWQDTMLELPPGGWHNQFTGEIFSGEVRMEIMFKKFPVALLFQKENH